MLGREVASQMGAFIRELNLIDFLQFQSSPGVHDHPEELAFCREIPTGKTGNWICQCRKSNISNTYFSVGLCLQIGAESVGKTIHKTRILGYLGLPGLSGLFRLSGLFGLLREQEKPEGLKKLDKLKMSCLGLSGLSGLFRLSGLFGSFEELKRPDEPEKLKKHLGFVWSFWFVWFV
jgi:hypothetical protein